MIYVTSDLHGFPLSGFKKLLDKAGFTSEDTCYVLGDVIDRGSESIELLKWIMAEPNFYLLRGNHEDLFLRCRFLFEGEEIRNNPTKENIADFENWSINGGRRTLKELARYTDARVLGFMKYIEKAPLYKRLNVNGKEFLLVHGGLGSFSPKKQLCDYTLKELIWTRPEISQRYFDNIITVIGHTPTIYYDRECKGRIFKTDTWVDIDTGAASGYAPMLLRLDDMAEFYTET
ncbi:MAG: serine/threonine protein phosphatase [Clostridia bacterium]|nr:serine/threonine protein phosphatase [Clostridia bacterium]